MKISDCIETAAELSIKISNLKTELDKMSLNLDFRNGLSELEKQINQSCLWLDGYISALEYVEKSCAEGEDLEI